MTREEAIFYIKELQKTYASMDKKVAEAVDMAIEALQDRLKDKWILCSERLPKDDSWVIVTVLDERGDTSFRYTDFGWYLEAANCWIVDAEQRTDVMAWMPLPEPYREDNEKC